MSFVFTFVMNYPSDVMRVQILSPYLTLGSLRALFMGHRHHHLLLHIAAAAAFLALHHVLGRRRHHCIDVVVTTDAVAMTRSNHRRR